MRGEDICFLRASILGGLEFLLVFVSSVHKKDRVHLGLHRWYLWDRCVGLEWLVSSLLAYIVVFSTCIRDQESSRICDPPLLALHDTYGITDPDHPFEQALQESSTYLLAHDFQDLLITTCGQSTKTAF
jgi:hypothetical protein